MKIFAGIKKSYYLCNVKIKNKKNMDKIFLLIQDYVADCNAEFKVNAYKSIKSAKEALKNAVAESKPIDKENGFKVFTNKSTEYEAYIDGEYIDNHTNIYIKEVEVEN